MSTQILKWWVESRLRSINQGIQVKNLAHSLVCGHTRFASLHLVDTLTCSPESLAQPRLACPRFVVPDVRWYPNLSFGCLVTLIKVTWNWMIGLCKHIFSSFTHFWWACVAPMLDELSRHLYLASPDIHPLNLVISNITEGGLKIN